MSYIYPTEPGWIENMRDEWRIVNRPNFSFCFLNFTPHKLRELSPDGLFWMYLYYTQNRTNPQQYPNFARTARWRVHVLRHTINRPRPDNLQIYVYNFGDPNDKIWFICDILEEIQPIDYEDFTHLRGMPLGPTMKNSIPPIRNPCVVNPIHTHRYPFGNLP
jgi:hypothetical protein